MRRNGNGAFRRPTPNANKRASTFDPGFPLFATRSLCQSLQPTAAPIPSIYDMAIASYWSTARLTTNPSRPHPMDRLSVSLAPGPEVASHLKLKAVPHIIASKHTIRLA